MKILSVSSTSSPVAGHAEIISLLDRADIPLFLNEFVSAVPPETWLLEDLADLQQWTVVLNKIDLYLEQFIIKYGHILGIEGAELTQDHCSTEEIRGACDHTLRLLHSSCTLLKHSYNKEVYNSVDRLKVLLSSYDDSIAMVALDAFHALACPPIAHRCIEYTRHTTALHKSSTLCHPIFEIIDAANLMNKMSAEDICMGNTPTPEDMAILKFDFMNRLLTGKPNATEAADPAATASFALHTDNTILTLKLATDTRSIEQIIVDHAVPARYRLSLQWHIRIRRYMLSPNRADLHRTLHIQFSAAAILLCCHPSSLSLAHFFQDKVEFFRGFLFMVRTGLGSGNYVSGIPLELRLVSNECLSAIIGSKDATVSILSRFSWLQHDLGLNRGQYMGLLPCLLRYIFARLAAPEDSSLDTDTEFLVWAESLLTLVLSVLNVPTFLTAFVDNGMISLLLSVFKQPIERKQSPAKYNLESLVSQVLDMAISTNTHALAVFKDSNGLEIIRDKIVLEMALNLPMPELYEEPVSSSGKKRKASTKGSSAKKNKKTESSLRPPVASADEISGLLSSTFKSLLHGLLTIISSCLHEGYSDGSDNRLAQLIRSPNFSEIFHKIFSSAAAVSPPVIAAACSVLGEAINNDPAPPSVLTCMISNGVARHALASVAIPSLEFTGDSLLATSNLISSISLSEDGIQLIRDMNPFKTIVRLLTNRNYVLPKSRVFMGDLAGLLGNNFEELVRHHPAHTEPIMAALFSQVNHVADLAKNDSALTLEDNDGACMQYVQFAVSLLACLDPLLTRRNTAGDFLSRDGIHGITRLIGVGLGPPRYLLSLLSCSIDPTTSSIGIHPVIKNSIKCINRIAEHHSKQFLLSLLPIIKLSKERLNEDMTSYWENFGTMDTSETDAEAQPVVVSQSPAKSPKPKGRGKAATKSPIDAVVTPLRMENFLDTVSREQVHDCCVDGVLSEKLHAYVQVLRSFLHMDYLIEALTSSLTAFKAFDIDEYLQPGPVEHFTSLICDIYIGSQMELCRARGSLTDSRRPDDIKSHPVYRLLVVAPDSAVIKNAPDESGKKVAKLERGTIIDAYERFSTTSNVLKYRVEGGWVSYLRNSTTADPQVQVIDIREKPEHIKAAEKRDSAMLNTAQKIFDFEKYANVSSRRGGFMAIFHFHSCMRRLLQWLAKTLASCVLDTKASADPVKRAKSLGFIRTYLPLVMTSVDVLLPASEMNFTLDTTRQLSTDPALLANLQPFVIPPVAEFGIDQTFRAIHVVELCYNILFDDKKSMRPEGCNLLLLTHLFYSGVLEKLFKVTVNVFLCCVRPKKQADGIESAVDEDKDDDGENDGELSSEAKRERRVARDRRVLAISNIDNLMDCWRLLLSATGASPEIDSAGRVLQGHADAEHDLDLLVMKRQVLLLAVKYIYQCWDHPLLHTLPPTTVRTVLDLMQVTVKNIVDVKSMPDRYVPSSASTRDPRGDRGFQDPFLEMLQVGADANFIPASRARELLSGAAGRRFIAESANVSSSAGLDKDMLPVAEPPAAADKIIILPAILRASDETIKADRELLQNILKQLYRIVHPICLTLILHGVKSGGVHWSTEAAATNQSITRELTTVMILNQLFKCYERSSWVSSTLQIIHMAWLYRKTLQVLRSPNVLEAAHSKSLYGLLHGILLLLTGRVAATGKSKGHGNDVLILIFSRDSRYSALCDLLVQHIARVLEAASSPIDLATHEWITPALLVLDVFCQSYLVDSTLMRNTMSELEKVVKATAKNDNESLVATEVVESLTKEFKDRGYVYSSKDIPPVVTADDVETEFITTIAPEPLPDGSTAKHIQPSPAKKAAPPATVPVCRICHNTLQEPSIEFQHSINCGESGATIATGTCGHKFHLDCVQRWIKSTKHCPSCDAEWASASTEVLERTAADAETKTILKQGGLSQELKRKSLGLSLQVLALAKKDSPVDNLMSHSAIQLISHAVVDEELKAEFHVQRGVQQLLRASTVFPGLANMLFTVLQRLFEDPKCMAQVMETAMKLCVTRLAKQKGGTQKDSKGPKVQLRVFLEALSPLILRDQSIFMTAMRATLGFTKIDKTVFVHLKPASESAAPIESNQEVVSTPMEGRRQRSTSGDSAFKTSKHPHSSKKGGAVDPATHFLPQPVYASFECLILTICSQLALALELLRADATSPHSMSVSCLSINDLFFALADLVYTIPGLATCIHRFNLAKANTSAYPAIAACVARTKHTITTKPLAPVRFLTFLVHNLVAYDAALDEFRKNTPTPPTPAHIACLEEVKTLVGPSIEDGAAYFLAALIARPGDGRRRALEELLDVLRGDLPLDSSSRIKAVLAISKTVTTLVSPPPTWTSREIFVVPVKDNLILLATLQAHSVLSDVLCRLDMEHPLTRDATLQLAQCIEIILRKGIPLMQEQSKVAPTEAATLALPGILEQEPAAASTDRSTDDVIASVATPATAAVESAAATSVPATPLALTTALAMDNLLTNGRPIENMTAGLDTAAALHESDDAVAEDDSDEDDISEGDDDEEGGSEDEDSEGDEGDEMDEMDDDDDDDEGDEDGDEDDDDDGDDGHDGVIMDMDVDVDDDLDHDGDHDHGEEEEEDDDGDDREEDDEGEEEYPEDMYPEDDEDAIDIEGDEQGEGTEEDVGDEEADDEQEEMEDSFGGEENFQDFEQDLEQIRASEDEYDEPVVRLGRPAASGRRAEYEDASYVSHRRRHALIPSFHGLGEAMGAARVFVNAEGGGMRIRLPEGSSGGLAEFLDHLPAALSMNGMNASVSIVNGDGTVLSTSRTGEGSRVNMQQFIDSSVRRLNRSDFIPNSSNVHPLLSTGTGVDMRRPRGASGNVPVRRPGFSIPQSAALEGLFAGDFLGGDMRPRAGRRNTLGPLLSDRRWGTDIGTEEQFVDARLPVLVAAVEDALKGQVEMAIEAEAAKPASSAGRRAEAYARFSRHMSAAAGPPDESSPQLEVEESKEEGELQEFKEGEDEVVSSSTPALGGGGSIDEVSNARESLPTERAVALSDDDFFDEENNDNEEAEDDQDDDTEEAENGPACPAGYDPEVWAMLPSEVQNEILGSAPPQEQPMDVGLDIDREVLSSLPPELREEALEYERQRSSSVASAADAMAVAPVDNSANENAAFVASLSADLRRDVLLGADEAFLASLPNHIQSEARRLRRAAGFAPVGRPVAIATGAASGDQQGQMGEAYWNPIQVAAENALLSVHRHMRLDAPGAMERIREHRHAVMSFDANRHEGMAGGASRAASTVISIVDDRLDSPLPFSHALVCRLILHLIASHKTRCPRPIIRLLSCFCRYRASREWLLQALAALLNKDSDSLRLAMLHLSPNEGALPDVQVILNFATSPAAFDVTTLRRFMGAISYLNRKVPRLVWLDIMTKPSPRGSDRRWIFGALIDHIGKIVKLSGFETGVDIILHIIEEFCEPFTKYTIAQADTASPTTEASMVPMPFPELLPVHFEYLAAVIRANAPRMSSSKVLLRIMKTLALNTSNWSGMLANLTRVAVSLSEECLGEIGRVCAELLKADGDPQTAIALPLFCIPSSNVESTLFQVLQYMKTMRADLSAECAAQISAQIDSIDFGNMWERLSESLELVRKIEGLIEPAEDDESPVDSAEPMEESSSAFDLAADLEGLPRMSRGVALSSSTSTLIMRFMPLIQCFFTVCDSTLLRRPTATTDPVVAEQQSSRKRPRDEGADMDEAILGAADKLVKPGEKFRRHAEYQAMQMELENKPLSERLVRFVEKNAVLLNMLLHQNINLVDSSFHPLICVPRLRHQLHFDIKREYFRVKLKKLRHSAARMHGPLRLSVRRDHVFEDSLAFFDKLRTGDEVRRKLAINFEGEEGMDAGGLTREWYMVLAREMFNPNYALFTATSDGVTFQPNTNSGVVHTHHLMYFKFVGRIIGKAICDGHLLDAHFTRSFYKHILGLPVNYQDLEAIEPDYYKSLRQILELPLECLGLELTFSTEVDEFGRMVIKPLIENGQNIPVTDENKALYVQLVAHSRMTTAIEKQIDAFLTGFHELVPAELVSLFDAQELELLISGLPDIDLDDLRANCEYHGYKASDPHILSFWNVLRSFTKEEKALFLQFVTGTSKVPLDGFKALQGSDGVRTFNIHKAYGATNLPSAHTCFNQLDLPEYPSEEVLREKLLIAIKEGSEGFGFA